MCGQEDIVCDRLRFGNGSEVPLQLRGIALRAASSETVHFRLVAGMTLLLPNRDRRTDRHARLGKAMPPGDGAEPATGQRPVQSVRRCKVVL